MYRTPSKRRKLIQRTIVYVLMTLFVVGLVTALVLLMLGYRFNRMTQTVEQGGLVQFISHPSGASVTVGQASLGSKTPSKITVNPGRYVVKMERKGYQTWQKTVDVEAGKVLWLNYAQLVPDKVNTVAKASFKTLAEARRSPSSRYFALLPDSRVPIVRFLDITDQKYKQTVADLGKILRDSSLPWRYSLADWSVDSTYILMKRQVAATTEWLLVNRREPLKSVNLTAKYDVTIETAQFDSRASNRLVVQTNDGDLRLIDVNNNSLSGVLLTKITSLEIYDGVVLYVQEKSENEQSVGYLTLGSHTGRELVQRTGKEKIIARMGSYYGDLYLMVATGRNVEVDRLSSLPDSASTGAITTTPVIDTKMNADPVDAMIRSRGRFVTVQSREGFLVYDLELGKLTTTSLGVAATGNKLDWVDSYHLAFVADGRLNLMEFDGENRHDVTPATAGYDSALSGDDKYLYSFQKTDTGVQLNRSQMIID